MLKKTLIAGLIGTVFANSMPAYAYDTTTHVAMTGFAFGASKLADPNSGVIELLGLTESLTLYPTAPFRGKNQPCQGKPTPPGQEAVWGDPSPVPRYDCYVAIGAPATTPSTWQDGDDRFANNIIQLVREVGDDKYPAYKAVIQQNQTLTGWLMRGAVREDDNDVENKASDDPGNYSSKSVMPRPFGHFYDPYWDRGLTIPLFTINGKTYGGFSPGAPAPKWALIDGTTIWSGTNPLSHTLRTNAYNWSAAREAYWRALTGTSKDVLTNPAYDGSDMKPKNPYDDSIPTISNYDLRKGYWAGTFRILGDMVHLIQDMAQPQHTRNDAHSGAGCIQGTNVCFGGHDSFYEKYIKARTLGDKSFSLSEGFSPDPTKAWAAGNSTTNTLAPLDFTSYATPQQIPRFDKIADYFSSGTSGGSLAGKGMANYSNRGFYSFGTNIGSSAGSTFPSPDPGGAGLSPLVMTSGVLDSGGHVVSGAVTYLVGNVNDTLTGTQDANVKLSTYGAWNQFLRASPSGKSQFTLNYLNYDDQARLLIPRAVAYSAGLIDYFFRSKMQISLPDEGVYGIVDHYVENQKDISGFRKIKLKIQNLTPTSTGGVAATSMSGKLVVVAKFHRNTCYTSTLSGEYGAPVSADMGGWEACRDKDEDVVTSDPISAPAGMDSSPQQVTFNFQKPIPINASDLYLQVVYRGPVGDPNNPDEADAIFVATKDISEPHYLYNYSRWDQYTYKSYWPIVDSPGTISYQNWCLGGTSPAFPNIAACNQAMGSTIKVQYSATTAPIPGYDPNNPSATSDPADPSLTPGTWHSLSKELPLQPVAVMTAPIGTLTRVAVLTDPQPGNTAMWLEELVDTTHNSAIFQWNAGTAVTTTNQMNLSDKTLTPSVTYISGRGVYMPSGENGLLNSGDANPMPQLQLVPSQINF
jgi:hypothetical protein